VALTWKAKKEEERKKTVWTDRLIQHVTKLKHPKKVPYWIER
jgi:hypothetical protein